jgi:hypothetical protein
MSMFMKRSDLIVAGVALLMEKTKVSKGVALSTATQLAAKIPTAPDWGDPGPDKVRAEVETGFLSELLEQHVHRGADWENDGDLDLSTSFAGPPAPPDALSQLDALSRKIEADERAARGYASVVPPSVPAPAVSFASQNQAFMDSIRRTPVAAPSYGTTGGTVLPTVAAAPGIGTIPIREVVPAGSVSKGPTGEPVRPPIFATSGQVLASLSKAAQRDVAEVISRSLATPVAKSHRVTVIKAT